jgi:hypothetical protein
LELNPCYVLCHISAATDGVCSESFNTAGKYVSINGVVRHSGVFFETYPTGAALRIVNLGVNAGNADSTVIKVSEVHAAGLTEPSTALSFGQGWGSSCRVRKAGQLMCTVRSRTVVDTWAPADGHEIIEQHTLPLAH